MTRPRLIDRSRFGSLHVVAEQCSVIARAFPHRRARCLAAQAWAPHRHQHRLGDYLRAQNVARDVPATGYRNICPVTALCGLLRRVCVAIVEMGVEKKMALEDQHGGHSHHTSHSTSSDLIASQYTSWTERMAILTGVEAREQVLLSTSLSTTLHFPPRSGCCR